MTKTKRCVNVMGLPKTDIWICLKKIPNDESCDNPYDSTCKSYCDKTGMRARPPKKKEASA